MAAVIASTPEDLEPIVVLDDEPTGGALLAEGTRRTDTLTEVARRSAAALAETPIMRRYLVEAGITDPAVWAAFRLGTGSEGLAAGLGTDDWTALTNLGLVHPARQTLSLAGTGGINLPTCDPRDPERVVGIVRLTAAQHKHRFLTPPAGVACATDIATAPRVVLVDQPLLGLRLAQAGVHGVAIVEDPAVLAPLAPWLDQREVLVVGVREERRAELVAALGTSAAKARSIAVAPDLARSTSESLEMLGLDRAALRGDGPRVPITPHLLRDLHEYAVARLAAGTATEALRALGIGNAAVVGAYRIGYLPADFRRALSSEQRRVLEGSLVGNALVVPACDEQGTIVDLLVVPAGEGRAPIPTVHDAPRGLIAPAVTTAFDAVVVVDSLRRAADLMSAGKRQIVLLRGVEDASANAQRIAANGVHRAEIHCQRHGTEIAASLRAAGIEVAHGAVVAGDAPSRSATVLEFPVATASTRAAPTASEPVAPEVPAITTLPVPVADLTLVHHDTRIEQATFRAGDLTYVAEVPWDDRTRIGVRIVCGGQEHPDRLDLAEEAQRRRCASSAALRTGAAAATIESHLRQLHHAVRGLAQHADAPPPIRAAPMLAMTEAERVEALDLARCPDLLDRVVADLGTLAWVGEESTKRFTFLAALSRNLDEPVWVALTSSGADERSVGLDAIAAITPPEDRIHVSRLTDSAFYYADPAALRHKLLIIDDAGSISTGVGTALRILRRRGALSATRVERDPLRGEVRTVFVEVRGPVALLTATSDTVDALLRPHVVEVAEDETAEHVTRVLAERRCRSALPGGRNGAERERAVIRLRNLQRVISPRSVTIPFAERIEGFGWSSRARRDHDTLLALIATHALLYQHQRLSASGSVVANTDDFEAVAALMNARLAIDDAGLGRHAQRLLAAIWSAQLPSVTMEDLARLLPDWTRHAFRVALDELVALDYLASPRSGRGARRTYHLHANAAGLASPSAARRVSLRPVGELAAVGGAEQADAISVNDTG